MSLNAFIWAANLPLDLVSNTAYRVLLKYADRANSRGQTAWATASDLADELGCSTRTIQRAVRELIVKGLLVEGDQRFVAHLRGDRKPIVYDLVMHGSQQPQFELHDTTDDDVPHDTTDMSRYDKPGLHDTTTGVAHRTVIEHISPTSVSTEAKSRRPLWIDDRCTSNLKTGKHEIGRWSKCLHCGEIPVDWLEATA